MKYFPLLFLIVACTSGPVNQVRQPSDTTYPLVIYQTPDGLQYGIWRKVTVDSLAWVDSDSTTKKKQWARVPVYYIPLFDSLAKQMKYYQVIPGLVLADMNINTESLSKLYPPALRMKPSGIDSVKK